MDNKPNLNVHAKLFLPQKRKHDELLSVLNNRKDVESDGVLARFKRQNKWLLEYDPLVGYLNQKHN